MDIPTIFPVACHTDNVGQGTIFVAIKGKKEDGAAHILKAVERGARAVYVDQACELDDVTKNEFTKQLNEIKPVILYVDNWLLK